MAIGVRNRSNVAGGLRPLFLSARSWVDSTGSGIPDWWEQYYFVTNGLDPYALCPSGDGWTLLQAYQNGWNPNLFYTPPPPQNVAAVLAYWLNDQGAAKPDGRLKNLLIPAPYYTYDGTSGWHFGLTVPPYLVTDHRCDRYSL
jgi:hypothetical protein